MKNGPHSPAISILLPAHNSAATLSVAVDSCLAQTERDFELLIIENGSTDGTLPLARALARQDSRIRVLELARAGLVTALNVGMGLASGRYIARMDADDLCHRDRLLEQRRFLEGHPTVGVVACRVAYGGDPIANRGFAEYVYWANRALSHDQIFLSRFVESPLVHPSVMFRRALAERHGAWRDGPFPEDYELWLRWMAAGVRFHKVDRVLLRWNDSPGRLSRADSRYSIDAFHACKARYLAEWLAASGKTKRDILVWGAGKTTRRRAGMLAREGISISAWVDIDPRKCGKRLEGKPVLARDELPTHGECFVIPYVSSRGARDQIAEFLVGRGFRAGRDFIAAG